MSLSQGLSDIGSAFVNAIVGLGVILTILKDAVRSGQRHRDDQE
ncbi:MAG TPA: hypothetical protein VLT35_05180 [Methanocella sp.]|nr:hypothetical protein [Methanocella sp.]